MPRAHFTDITVRSLKPKLGHQLKFWDRSTPGFGVRVNQHGTKSWIVMYGEQRQLKVIGRYPDMPLAAARAEAKKMLTHRVQPTPTITFEDALPLFLSTHCAQYNKPSTAKETERVLRINFLPALRAKALEDISTHNISGIVDRLLSTPAAANHAFTAIRTFFRWATRRRYIPHSPCEGLRLPTRPNTKDRVLNDDEIVAAWRAAEGYGFPFGTIVLLLLCTAQRRGEIGALKWSYIDFDNRTITLPDTKNNRPHTFPFGSSAAAMLESIPKLDSEYLFPARGKAGKPFNGWSKAKRALDKKYQIDYDLHDLRRTAASGMASLGVQPHVISKLLNHVSGTAAITGVAAIYNRFQYMDEMRAAIALWEERLDSLLAQQGL
jgi:integrase